MADQLLETYSIPIPARQYWNLQLPVSDVEGFYIFEVTVKQTRQALDDVGVQVMDEDNFKVWDLRLRAIRAGARAGELPSFVTFASVKLSWGTLSFRPPSPGSYQLVVDNTYSTFKQKEVTVGIYWISSEWSARRSVRQVARRLNWTQEWRLFELSEKDLENGRLSNSCDNLRKALILLWVKVCEALSKKPLTLDAGKSSDIGMLKATLSPYVPDYVIAELGQVWSLASELAHIEKRGGKEPPLNEVVYVFRLVYSSAGFLASIIPPSN